MADTKLVYILFQINPLAQNIHPEPQEQTDTRNQPCLRKKQTFRHLKLNLLHHLMGNNIFDSFNEM